MGSTTHIMQTLERDLQQQGRDLLSSVLGVPMHARMPWWAWASARLLGASYALEGLFQPSVTCMRRCYLHFCINRKCTNKPAVEDEPNNNLPTLELKTNCTGCKSDGEGYLLASICPGLLCTIAGRGIFRGQLRAHNLGLFFDLPPEEGHLSVPGIQMIE